MLQRASLRPAAGSARLRPLGPSSKGPKLARKIVLRPTPTFRGLLVAHATTEVVIADNLTKEEKKKLKDVVKEQRKALEMTNMGMEDDSSESESDDETEGRQPEKMNTNMAHETLKQQAAGLMAVGSLLSLDLQIARRVWQQLQSASTGEDVSLTVAVPLMEELAAHMTRLESSLSAANDAVEELCDCRKMLPMQAQQVVKMYSSKLEDCLEDLPCMACDVSTKLQTAARGLLSVSDGDVLALTQGRTSLALKLLSKQHNTLDQCCSVCAADLAEYAKKLLEAVDSQPTPAAKA